MPRGVRIGTVAALALLLTVGVARPPMAGAEGAPVTVTTVPGADAAQIIVSPASAPVGSEVVVQLVNWPNGPALVSTCGNTALRGSQDCNLPGTKGVAVREHVATFRFRVSEPPIHCPCVIRASTADSGLVRSAPFVVEGVPDGPPVEPEAAPTPIRNVGFRAEVIRADARLVDRVMPLVAGPTEMTLVVDVRNTGPTTVAKLRVVSAVGRNRSTAEPLPAATVKDLAPGASATVEIPVRIGVPAWGRYTIFGTVYGFDAPVRFETKTTVDPWLLEILIPLVLLVLAWLARRRERDEEDELAAVEGARALSDPLEVSSPSVGAVDEGRSRTDSYPPLHATVT